MPTALQNKRYVPLARFGSRAEQPSRSLRWTLNNPQGFTIFFLHTHASLTRISHLTFVNRSAGNLV